MTPATTAAPKARKPRADRAVPEATWNLRMACAERGIWTGAELQRLLAERAGLRLSGASISALMTKQPTQVRLSTLAALCAALDCTPNNLIAIQR